MTLRGSERVQLGPCAVAYSTSRNLLILSHRCHVQASRWSAWPRTATRAQRTSLEQATPPAPAQLTGKAAERAQAETAARQRFEEQATEGSGDQGMQRVLLNSALALLEEAAVTRKVDQELVLGALTSLEAAALSGSTQLQDVMPDLEGRWRLVYSSGTLPALRYIPVPEFLSIAAALRSVVLSSDIGPVHTEFSGRFDWRPPTDMDFAFTATRVLAFKRTLLEKQRDSQQKTWVFFHAGPRIAAARSSAGGLNLMSRQSAFRHS